MVISASTKLVGHHWLAGGTQPFPGHAQCRLRGHGPGLGLCASAGTARGSSQAVAGVLSLGFLGANVTIPPQRRGPRLMDELSPGAELIGAVNTIACQDGRLIGHNTDGIGFLRSLEGKWSPGERRSSS